MAIRRLLGFAGSAALLSIGCAPGPRGTAAAGTATREQWANVEVPRAIQIAAGRYHTCTVLSDGTGKCWGWNFWGVLGNGSFCSGAVAPQPVYDLSEAVQISANESHTCAVLTDGTVACWGRNVDGELGDGTRTRRLFPVNVSGLVGATQVVVGHNYTCALLAAGTVMCWGSNRDGQLGDGTRTHLPRPLPAPVNGLTGVTQLTSGTHHACALLSDATARCWGDNSAGALGDGTDTPRFVPTPVSGLTDAVQLTAGAGHTCALRRDGTAKCWGWNNAGQLGDGTMGSRLVPTAVWGLAGAARLAAFVQHTCAIMSDGTANCWGHNSFGQLGDGTNVTRLVPTKVLDLDDVEDIAIGVAHTCALVSDGSVRCWGDNLHGQLGNGGTSDYSTPTPVLSETPPLEPDGCPVPAERSSACIRPWGPSGVYCRCETMPGGTVSAACCSPRGCRCSPAGAWCSS